MLQPQRSKNCFTVSAEQLLDPQPFQHSLRSLEPGTTLLVFHLPLNRCLHTINVKKAILFIYYDHPRPNACNLLPLLSPLHSSKLQDIVLTCVDTKGETYPASIHATKMLAQKQLTGSKKDQDMVVQSLQYGPARLFPGTDHFCILLSHFVQVS